MAFIRELARKLGNLISQVHNVRKDNGPKASAANKVKPLSFIIWEVGKSSMNIRVPLEKPDTPSKY